MHSYTRTRCRYKSCHGHDDNFQLDGHGGRHWDWGSDKQLWLVIVTAYKWHKQLKLQIDFSGLLGDHAIVPIFLPREIYGNCGNNLFKLIDWIVNFSFPLRSFNFAIRLFLKILLRT